MTKIINDKIKKLISSDGVVLFMKGDSDFPQCGFSANVVGILNYFEEWSKLVRVIYKNVTATRFNPSGEIISFECISPIEKKKGQILIFINSLFESKKNYNYLSVGERIICAFSIFTAFNYLVSPPIIILDEIDSNLDTLYSEKLFIILKKLEKKKNLNIFFVTHTIKNDLFSSQFMGIFRTQRGSNAILFKR